MASDENECGISTSDNEKDDSQMSRTENVKDALKQGLGTVDIPAATAQSAGAVASVVGGSDTEHLGFDLPTNVELSSKRYRQGSPGKSVPMSPQKGSKQTPRKSPQKGSKRTPRKSPAVTKRPRRRASLAIPKRIAEFTEQAKMIKKAFVEERLAMEPRCARGNQSAQKGGSADHPEFCCGLCNATASSMVLLADHFKRVHGVGLDAKEGDTAEYSGEESVTCGFCGKEERTTKALMIHFVLKHPASSTMIAADKLPATKFFGAGEFVCGLCGIRKKTDLELMNHHRIVHPVFPPPFGQEKTAKIRDLVQLSKTV